MPAPGTRHLERLRHRAGAVQAGNADGISYVLTEADPFAAIDLDHCRDPNTHSIDAWAQNFLDVARHTYSEVTPSGDGCRIWGLTGPDTDPVHRKFTLEIDGKPIAVELFRHTSKVLTVTGYRLDTIRELGSLDRAFGWANHLGRTPKGTRQKRHSSPVTASTVAGPVTTSTLLNGSCVKGQRPAPIAVTCFTWSSAITLAVAGALSRSVNTCGNTRTASPAAISVRAGLSREISRSASKYTDRALPLLDGWKAPEISVEAPEMPPGRWILPCSSRSRRKHLHRIQTTTKTLRMTSPNSSRHCLSRGFRIWTKTLTSSTSVTKPARPKLPPLYAHGDRDPWPLKAWLIKTA